MRCIIHFDGGSRGNPGPAGVGVVISDTDNHPLHEAGYYLGRCTNNVAEYEGLIRSLQAARQLGCSEAEIISDSELLVRQVNGQYRVKSANLQPLYRQAQQLLSQFDSWRIGHVLRDKNRRADELANMAMNCASDVIETDRTDSAEHNGVSHSQPGDIESCEVPIWTATYTVDRASQPDHCPAQCQDGMQFEFREQMPAGLCIHAAKALLKDGPLHWPADKLQGETRCPECQVKIRMKLVT